MSSLWLDVRYALRMMMKAPGLTAVLITTLALGIGASTTIFSVVNSIVLRPLPYDHPERLVRVYTEFHGKLALKRFWMSAPELDELTKACRSCESVGAWARGSASLAGGDRPIRVDAAGVTHPGPTTRRGTSTTGRSSARARSRRWVRGPCAAAASPAPTSTAHLAWS